MQDISKKQWLIGTILALVFLAFFFAWLFTDQTIVLSEDNNWIKPALGFSLGISLLSLIAFVSKQKMVTNIASAVAFVPILLFVQESLLVFFIGIGIFLSGWGLTSMRRDAESHRHIRVRRSVQHGIGRLVFAFALVISTLYYTHIRDVNGEELVRKLSFESTSHVILTQALGMVNPEFKKANKENITVDQFLMTLQKNQSEGVNDNLVALNTQKLMLEQGRKQLSDTVGTPLFGQEPIADILSQIIDQHIRNYVRPNTNEGSSTLLPFVLSVLLFITLWSLGALLAIVWGIMTALFFSILRRLGLIEIKKIMVEQEVIE